MTLSEDLDKTIDLMVHRGELEEISDGLLGKRYRIPGHKRSYTREIIKAMLRRNREET